MTSCLKPPLTPEQGMRELGLLCPSHPLGQHSCGMGPALKPHHSLCKPSAPATNPSRAASPPCLFLGRLTRCSLPSLQTSLATSITKTSSMSLHTGRRRTKPCSWPALGLTLWGHLSPAHTGGPFAPLPGPLHEGDLLIVGKRALNSTHNKVRFGVCLDVRCVCAVWRGRGQR